MLLLAPATWTANKRGTNSPQGHFFNDNVVAEDVKEVVEMGNTLLLTPTTWTANKKGAITPLV